MNPNVSISLGFAWEPSRALHMVTLVRVTFVQVVFFCLRCYILPGALTHTVASASSDHRMGLHGSLLSFLPSFTPLSYGAAAPVMVLVGPYSLRPQCFLGY